MPRFIECCIVADGGSMIKADLTKTTLLNVDAVSTIDEWEVDEQYKINPKTGKAVIGCHIRIVPFGNARVAGYTAKQFAVLLAKK